MPFATRPWNLLLAGSCVIALGACSRTQEVSLLPPDDSPRIDASKIDPKATSLKLADGTYARGDYGMAAQLYFRASELDPTNPEIATKLAFALFKTGGAADAEKLFRGVLEHHPNNADAKRGLAHSLVLQNKPGEAIPIYRKALEDPAGKADARLYAGLGAAFDSIGKHAEARSVYEAGLRIKPDDAGLKNNLAISFAMAGQLDKAKKILEDAPNSPNGADKIKESLSFVNTLLASANGPAAKNAEKTELAENNDSDGKGRAPVKNMDRPGADANDEVVVVTAPPSAEPAKRPTKANADLPSRFTANSEVITVKAPRSSHAEHAKGSIADNEAVKSDIGAAASSERTGEDSAGEIIQLIGLSERGPRFVWQEANKSETD